MCVGYAPVVLIMPLFCVAWWSCKKPTSQHKRASSLKRWKTFFYLRWEIFWDLNQKSAPNPSTILIPTYVQPHRKTGGPAGTTSFPLAKFKLEVESNLCIGIQYVTNSFLHPSGFKSWKRGSKFLRNGQFCWRFCRILCELLTCHVVLSSWWLWCVDVIRLKIDIYHTLYLCASLGSGSGWWW